LIINVRASAPNLTSLAAMLIPLNIL